MALSDGSSEYIVPVMEKLTAGGFDGKSVTLRFASGETFVVTKQWKMLPNGYREISFEPGKGARNNCSVVPESPLQTGTSSTKVPAGVGFKIGAAEGAVLGILIILEAMKSLYDLAKLAELQKALDIEIISGILQTMPQAEEAGIGKGVGRATRTKDKSKDNAKRYRIYGYSRKGA